MAQVHCPFIFSKHIPAGYRCERGSHPCPSIHFLLGGHGRLFLGDAQLDFTGSSILVIQADTVYWIEQGSLGLHVVLGIRGCSAERIRTGSYPVEGALLRIGEDIRALLADGGPSAHARIELLAGLAALDLVQRYDAAPATSLAERAHAIIDGEFQKPLEITTLAARLHVSTDHLRERFRLAYGEPPSQHLLHRRIKAAQAMLSDSALPIQDIARLCGIPDPFYFSRQFHRTTGLSPTQWREQAGHREAPR